MDLTARIKTALGERKPDLVLKNATIVNVFTGQLEQGDAAIADGAVVGVGSYDGDNCVDLTGKYLVPGFINAHCHVESSMVLPSAYCREELRHGVTTVITDPHEIANVAGTAGIDFMLSQSEGLPVNYYVQVPSCVPATPFEHSGAVLGAGELAPFRAHPRVTGLGEMMNYPGVAGCDSGVLEKLAAFRGTAVDGHAPSITGKGLQAYVCAGIRTDHESVTWEEAKEKLRAGMAVLVREGSASRNLEALVKGIVRDGVDTRNLAFCTDDKHLSDMRREGTIRHNMEMAISLGLSPVAAVQMATINAARVYGLSDQGAVAPGFRADLVVLDDLEKVAVSAVYKDGVRLVSGTDVTWPPEQRPSGPICDTVRFAPLTKAALALPDRESYPVIGVVRGQIITEHRTLSAMEVKHGFASGTLRKMAVVERHHETGCVGVGLISGYGLTHGAVGTTVAHDSHNLILVGDNDGDLLLCAETLKQVHGGYCLCRDGKVLGVLPLEAGGLMSTEPTEQFLPQLDRMLALAKDMGVAEGIDPFITLSFMALPVIPALRLTDMGMFDVEKFAFVE